MKLFDRNIFQRLIVAISLLTALVVVSLLFFQDNTILAIVLLIAVVLFLIGSYSFLASRGNLLDKYYGQLYSLIGSLSLETEQKPFTQKKRFRSILELEDVINSLYLSVRKKTTELHNRNLQLSKKQIELQNRNKELTLAYKALKESRARYDKLVLNLEEEYFLYSIDISGKITYVSSSVEKILGYTKNEYILKRDELFTSNPINEDAKKVMGKINQGVPANRFIIELFHVDCSPKILEISEVVVYDEDKEPITIEGIAHDITEGYNAEELIREQTEKYRQVFNSASDFIFLFNVKKDNKAGKFIEANNYTQNVLGYTQEELHQMTPDDLIAAEIWNGDNEHGDGEKYERIWEAKDGTIINVEISEHSFMIKGRKASIAVARDITERKRAVEEIKFMNEELVNQKENLEALLDNLTQTQEQLVQSEKMAALGQLIAGVAHEINTPLGAIKASVGNLSDSLESALKDLPDLFKSQSEKNITLFLLIFELSRAKKPDLTSREKREHKRKIRRDLGRHNIKDADVIADLLVYLEVYKGYEEHYELLKQPEALTVLRNARDFISLLKNTKTINIASDKASKVVFALKKYAHRDSLGEKVPTDIVDGIETVLTLYDNQLKQGINIVKNMKEIPLAMCYQDEINQVWTNLIQNAIQAMGQMGTLTINAHNDEKNIFVSITDTGEGIEPTIREKIFDPFFTTKKQGEGSGLGLDIVKKIIDKHGGTINVKSEIGEGASFLITLPLI